MDRRLVAQLRTGAADRASLPTAAIIGRVTVRGLTVLKLRGPAGWTCATATSTRNKGAGCARNGASVTIVRLG